MRRTLSVLLASLGIAAVLAAAGMLHFPRQAEAAAPTIEKFHEEFSFDIPCGTFFLHEDIVVDVTDILFFDEAGNPDHAQVHVNLLGIITNPDGETFRDPGYQSVFIDFAGTPEDPSDDTVVGAGLVFNITVPGQGSVVQDTGLIIFEPDGDVIIHGPHEQFEQGNELLCSVLG